MRLTAILIITSAVTFGASPAAACTTKDFKCSLQADAAPTSQPWTEPARFAYTINNDGPDSYAVDIVGKAMFDLRMAAPVYGLAELVWHRNNQQKKKQNDLQAAAGLHFEFDNVPSDGPITPGMQLYSVFADAKLGYSRKSIYADKSSAACVADPDLVTCRTQHLESVRGTLDVSPHIPAFESPQPFKSRDPARAARGKFDGPPVAYSFGLLGTAFWDKIVDNKVDAATGFSIRGAVAGLRGKANLAFSPRFANYKLVFRGSAQWIQAVSRADGRSTDFEKSSHLVTASLDYDLGPSTFAQTEPGFIPAIGITYTDGSDPLTARADQSTIVLGLKLAYRYPGK